jgi:hypothetical protein
MTTIYVSEIQMPSNSISILLLGNILVSYNISVGEDGLSGLDSALGENDDGSDKAPPMLVQCMYCDRNLLPPIFGNSTSLH